MKVFVWVKERERDKERGKEKRSEREIKREIERKRVIGREGGKETDIEKIRQVEGRTVGKSKVRQ